MAHALAFSLSHGCVTMVHGAALPYPMATFLGPWYTFSLSPGCVWRGHGTCIMYPMGNHLLTMVLIIVVPWMYYNSPWDSTNWQSLSHGRHSLAHGTTLHLAHGSVTIADGQWLLAHGCALHPLGVSGGGMRHG
jgi:hypothetical protein